jgi:hypothetical protein
MTKVFFYSAVVGAFDFAGGVIHENAEAPPTGFVVLGRVCEFRVSRLVL